MTTFGHTRPTNLLELCEPLFQYICLYNRSARLGSHRDLRRVRAEIKAILANLAASAGADAHLRALYQPVELPLLFFIDSMVKTSPVPGAAQWQELAREHPDKPEDDTFFDLLDETLADPSDDAVERIAVFYTCMGLGYSGWYTGQPEFLRKKMIECAARLRDRIDADPISRICPENYDNINTANLVEPPGASLVGIGIALVGLIIVLFAANFYLYYSTSSQLRGNLDRIGQTAPPATRPAQNAESANRPTGQPALGLLADSPKSPLADSPLPSLAASR